MRADKHDWHHVLLRFFLQPLIHSLEQTVPRLSDHMSASEFHDKPAVLSAIDVHFSEALVVDAIKESKSGRGVVVVAHLNCQNVIDIKLIIVQGGL